jgi:hypothetical protein
VKENFHGIRMAREIFIVLTVWPFINVFPLAPASKNTCIAYRIPRLKIPGIERSSTYVQGSQGEGNRAFPPLRSFLRSIFCGHDGLILQSYRVTIDAVTIALIQNIGWMGMH